MCNLNVIIKTEKNKNKDNYVNFLSCVSAISYNSNGDGDGIYTDYQDFLVKSKNKINLLPISNEINRSNFIITHQRIATHGLSEKYTQPFKSKRFVFAHNGIMAKFSNGKYSDSYGFFRRFIKKFNKFNDVVKTIKNMFDNKYLGSYSICIYDRYTRELYYFKNSNTDIHFYRNKKKDIMYFTTKENNEQFLKMFFLDNKFKEIKIKDNSIYKIKIKEKRICIIEVNEIKELKVITDVWGSSKVYSSYGWMNNYNPDLKIKDKEEEIKKEIEDQNKKLTLEEIKIRLNIVNIMEGLCNECHEKTSNFSRITSENICDKCLEEIGEEIINHEIMENISYV